MDPVARRLGTVWLPVNVLAAERLTKALGGKPPSRLAFRFGTWAVEFTTRGGTPLGAVENNCIAVTIPLALTLPPPSTLNLGKPLVVPLKMGPPAVLSNRPATPLGLAATPNTPTVVPVVAVASPRIPVP